MFRRVAILLVVGLGGCASQQPQGLVVSAQETPVQYQQAAIPPPEAAPPTTQALPTPAPAAPRPVLADEDQALARQLVATSRMAYASTCGCPYDTDKAGPCGDRSAYARGTPNRPLCFTSDVTPEMIRRQRAGDAALAHGTN